MLTGLIAPTSGQVSVFGQDLNDVRNTFGVCPQHDILFDSLTVREHLEFYGALKGVPHEQLQHSINVKLNEVGLVEKAEALASTLSGGQKRKLSVCIALIGDSKVVFLDEPTSGMDPVSRRLIWTLLQSYRRDRVIVLTTHFMDEADLLADRIAIMSKGRLKCCGSSLFLKQRFGLGYNLVVEKADASTVEQSHNGMLIGGACNEKALTALIHQSIHGSKLLTNAAREVSYMLPLSQVHEFAALLEQLENGVCGVKQYGISLTTLEEVFLRIAAEEAVDEQDQNSTELESPFLSTSAPSYQSIHLDSGVDALIDDLPPTQRAPWHLQLKSMAMKRILMLKRDWRAMCVFICAFNCLSNELNFFRICSFWMVVFPVYCLVWLFVSLSFVASTDHITPPELPLSFIAELNYANSPFELTVSTLVDSQSAAAAAVTFSSFTPFNPVTLINTTRTATTELYGVLLDQTFTSYVSLAVNQLSTSMTGDLTMVLNGSALHAAPIALNSILNAVGRAANVRNVLSNFSSNNLSDSLWTSKLI
jgi:ABC-type multidrug transport system ATPase subunit